MLFLIWYDDTPKRAPAEKIRQGCARYMERYDVAPNVVLVNEVDLCAVSGVEVRPLARIRPNNFHIGVDQGAPDAPPR